MAWASTILYIFIHSFIHKWLVRRQVQNCQSMTEWLGNNCRLLDIIYYCLGAFVRYGDCCINILNLNSCTWKLFVTFQNLGVLVISEVIPHSNERLFFCIVLVPSWSIGCTSIVSRTYISSGRGEHLMVDYLRGPLGFIVWRMVDVWRDAVWFLSHPLHNLMFNKNWREPVWHSDYVLVA